MRVVFDDGEPLMDVDDFMLILSVSCMSEFKSSSTTLLEQTNSTNKLSNIVVFAPHLPPSST